MLPSLQRITSVRLSGSLAFIRVVRVTAVTQTLRGIPGGYNIRFYYSFTRSIPVHFQWRSQKFVTKGVLFPPSPFLSPLPLSLPFSLSLPPLPLEVGPLKSS